MAGSDSSDTYLAAIGDILRTLISAPIELDAVLDAILRHAVGLCRADQIRPNPWPLEAGPGSAQTR